MTNIEKLAATAQELVEELMERLESYKEGLLQKPDDTFYKGLVKNTEEFIDELKDQIRRLLSIQPKENKDELSGNKG